MKCNKCQTDMIERDGKYGKFLCCPKSNPSDNHGTLTILKGRPATGRFHNAVDLDMLIQHQMMGMGVKMSDLDLFVEGGVGMAEDDDDHWMNVRMY